MWRYTREGCAWQRCEDNSYAVRSYGNIMFAELQELTGWRQNQLARLEGKQLAIDDVRRSPRWSRDEIVVVTARWRRLQRTSTSWNQDVDVVQQLRWSWLCIQKQGKWEYEDAWRRAVKRWRCSLIVIYDQAMVLFACCCSLKQEIHNGLQMSSYITCTADSIPLPDSHDEEVYVDTVGLSILCMCIQAYIHSISIAILSNGYCQAVRMQSFHRKLLRV